MSKAIVTESKLVAIGDAIRSVAGTSATMTLDQMASAILSLSGGGGGGGDSNELYSYLMNTLSEITTSIPYIPSSCFQSKSGLVSANFTNASYIGRSAFYGCYNLETLNFSMSLTSIGSYAFNGCSKLSNVDNIINGVSFGSLGGSIFTYAGVTSLNYTGSITGEGWFKYCNKLSIISLPNCTIVGSNTFTSCKSVFSLYCPNVVSTSQQAFYGTSFLSSGVSEMSLIFPNLEYVAGNAFGECYLPSTYLYLPKVTYVHNFGFPFISPYEASRKLSKVYLPLCSYVGNSAFRSNYSLGRVSLPSVNYIGDYTFYQCSSLSILDLTGVSSVVTLAGTWTFYSTPMSSSSYLGYFGSIYVPSSLYASFVAATNWATYSARITSASVPSE